MTVRAEEAMAALGARVQNKLKLLEPVERLLLHVSSLCACRGGSGGLGSQGSGRAEGVGTCRR